jgi:hypothetical protein
MNAVHDTIQDEAAAPATGRKSKAAIRAQHELASEQEPTARRELVAIAAYYLAERRSFEPGCELDDWLAAENEVEKQLRQSA